MWVGEGGVGFGVNGSVCVLVRGMSFCLRGPESGRVAQPWGRRVQLPAAKKAAGEEKTAG